MDNVSHALTMLKKDVYKIIVFRNDGFFTSFQVLFAPFLQVTTSIFMHICHHKQHNVMPFLCVSEMCYYAGHKNENR